MLVVTRKVGEEIIVSQCQLTVTVLDATPGRVRLGITAPPDVVVHRREVCERASATATLEAEDAMKSIRILVADRDEYRLENHRDYLRQHGASVATATTGVACVTQLRDFAPDVLVLDGGILWGGADGVLAAITEEPDVRPTYVLLLMQGHDRSLLYRLSSYKVDDFQTTPISSRRLMERIGHLLAVNRPISSHALPELAN